MGSGFDAGDPMAMPTPDRPQSPNHGKRGDQTSPNHQTTPICSDKRNCPAYVRPAASSHGQMRNCGRDRWDDSDPWLSDPRQAAGSVATRSFERARSRRHGRRVPGASAATSTVSVALKELSSFHARRSPEFAERFLREARLAGSLSHPNIVTVHDYFEQDGIPYIAMEYVPGGSLRPYVGRLTLAQIAGVLEGVLAGLAHAEQAGIVHRDLKPENIMVTADGRVKIADFGIAKATQRAGMTSAF